MTTILLCISGVINSYLIIKLILADVAKKKALIDQAAAIAGLLQIMSKQLDNMEKLADRADQSEAILSKVVEQCRSVKVYTVN